MPTGLILHCGAHAVPRSALDLVVTPTATDTWQPIPHHHLLKQVEALLPRHGLSVISEAHALSHEQSRYFGLLQVRNGQLAHDYSLVVGLRNSHDKSIPAGLVVGASVFVCDNLAFSGEIQIARKHTPFIIRDLPVLLEQAMLRLEGCRATLDQRIATYKSYPLSDRDANDLLVNAIDVGAICAARLHDVLREWRTPEHPEFLPRTCWSWFNAVTAASKGRLHDLPARTLKLHMLCDERVGLV